MSLIALNIEKKISAASFKKLKQGLLSGLNKL